MSRRLVLLSLVLASGAYLVSLGIEQPRLATWAMAAAVAAAFGARAAPALTQAVLVVSAFVLPGLLFFVSGLPNVPSLTVWLVPLAAFLVAERPLTDWSLPRRWRGLLAVWALLVAACWPIVFLRELDFTPAMLNDIYSNGLVPDRISRWATDVAGTALCLMVVVVWCDRCLSTTGRSRDGRRMPTGLLPAVGVGAGIATAVALYQSWFSPRFLNHGVWLESKRATGTLVDGNALGILAATWAPVLAGLVWPTTSTSGSSPEGGRTWRRVAAVAILVTGWLVVFASGSRTAFAAILVATGFTAAALKGSMGIARSRVLAVAAATVVGFAALLGAGATGMLRTATPLQRIAATLPAPTVAGMTAFARSMWLRDGWGQASVTMIADHPLAGVGIGTFSRQSVDYYERLTGRILTPDNAQNWWRQQAAEFGVAGALFAVALTVLVARLLARRAPPEWRMAAGGVRGALAGLAVASLFGVPTVTPIVAVSAWTFLFLAVRLLEEPDRSEPRSSTAPAAESRRPNRGPLEKLATLAAAAFVLVVAVGQLYAGTHDLRPPMRAMRAGTQYGYGFWRGGIDAQGQPFWWTGRRAVFVFPLEPGVLEFIGTPMHPDIRTRPVRVEFWLDGLKVLEKDARDDSPIALRLPSRGGQRAVFVETRVSRTFAGAGGAEQGLQIQKNYAKIMASRQSPRSPDR